MFKFNRGLCALLVCAVAGAAYAAVVKLKEINPMGSGLSLNPNCDGMAIFHYKEPDGNVDAGTEVNIVLTDFEPNTTYWVRYEGYSTLVETFLGGTPVVTTNSAGNAHVNDFFSGFDITVTPRVIVFIDNNGEGDYVTTDDDERACASADGFCSGL